MNSNRITLYTICQGDITLLYRINIVECLVKSDILIHAYR